MGLLNFSQQLQIVVEGSIFRKVFIQFIKNYGGKSICFGGKIRVYGVDNPSALFVVEKEICFP